MCAFGEVGVQSPAVARKTSGFGEKIGLFDWFMMHVIVGSHVALKDCVYKKVSIVAASIDDKLLPRGFQLDVVEVARDGG